MLEHAPDWAPATTDPSFEGITLVVLGDAGTEGRTADQVADALEPILTDGRRQAHPPIVLWVGNNHPERDPAPLHEVVARYVSQGGQSFAVGGSTDWRLGFPDGPWQRPALHYVVRVPDDGDAELLRTCNEHGCVEVSAHPSSGVVDLVVADLTPWLEPAFLPVPATLAALDHLLQTLTDPPSDAPPRILVSHLPVEAAGIHGLGGRHPDSTFHMLPPALQRSLRDGVFVGVVAGRDRVSYASTDITQAIARADKTWLVAPIFQVVSGAASRPVRRSGALGPRLRYFNSSALVPEVFTPAAGFATVQFDARGTGRATVYGRHTGRWQTASVDVSTSPLPHPAEAARTRAAPCLRCPTIPASER